MKKLIGLILAGILLTMGVACGPSAGNPSTSNKTETQGNTRGEIERILLFSGSELDYRIVVPTDATETQTKLSQKIATAAKEVTGKNPSRVPDQTKKYPEQEKEILLGLTSRTASQTVRETIEDGEYCIRFEGSKLVLLAANDILLSKAVDDLIASWEVSDKQISVARRDRINTGYDSDVLFLMAESTFTCPFVVGSNVSAETRDTISSLLDALKEDLGLRRLTIALDTSLTEEASATEILIGKTNRTESQQVLNTLMNPGFRITVVGKKIVIAATDEESLCSAVIAICDEIRQAKKGTVTGGLVLSASYSFLKISGVTDEEWLLDVPTFSAGTLTGGYSASTNTCIMIYENTERSDYDTYLQTLEQNGYSCIRTEALGDNVYRMYSGAHSTVYASFTVSSGCTRIYAEKAGEFQYPAKDDSGIKEYPARLWQLEVDNKNSKENGGMSYVFRCADGSFFIIDGGYDTETEADRIYQFLKENTPAGKETVISGWFISHLHGDHYGALTGFSKKYAEEIDVKAFYYHFNPISKVETAMNCWPQAVRYGRLHTGMEFSVSGLQIQVIYTLEDLYPVLPSDLNETCTVIRVTAEGQRLMFLGDICDLASDMILRDIPSSELQSDIVQVSHHGYEGAKKALYQAINAATALWPMNIVGYQESYATVPQNVFEYWYLKLPSNQYLVQSDTVKKIFVAGFGTAEIPLPYTPGGEKLGDFRAFFQQVVSGS